MLAYAAHRRSRRRYSPSTLVLIVGAHAVALTMLATAKMDLGDTLPPVVTRIFDVPNPPPPPEEVQPLPQQPSPAPPRSQIDTPPVIIPVPPHPGPSVDLTPAPPTPGPIIGTNPVPLPQPVPIPTREPAPVVKTGPKLATAGDLLRPPYPESKRRMEEEATLRLRLSIDERGRVTAVEPIGNADAAFLDSARRHLMRTWRYTPAKEDGRAVPSSLVITLRFQLEDA